MHLSLTRWMLRAGTAVTLAFIYLPLVIIGMYAFNERRNQRWPIEDWTTGWFSKALDNPGVRDAFTTSLKAAVGATLIAVSSERSRRSRSRATASSGARPSRSS